MHNDTRKAWHIQSIDLYPRHTVPILTHAIKEIFNWSETNRAIRVCTLNHHVTSGWDLLYKAPKYKEPVSFSWHQNFITIMDECEEYAIRWAKKEDVEIDTLSEWVKSINDLLKRRIWRLNRNSRVIKRTLFICK